MTCSKLGGRGMFRTVPRSAAVDGGTEIAPARDASKARPPRGALATALIVGLLFGVFILAGCEGLETGEQGPGDHPAVTQGQACSSCKDAPAHDYAHDEPFDDPDCLQCHTLESWTRVSHVHTNEEFDDGFHMVVGCVYCHTEEEPVPPADCNHCHEPQHPVMKPCVACHNANVWRIQNPLPQGHVSLARGHAELTCFSCHTGRAPLKQPRQCVSCHGRKHGGLTECARCHDPSRGWDPKPGFDHDAFFPLRGQHRKLACAKCHPNDRFAGTSTNCVGCHGAKHGGLRACAQCHTTAGFKPSTFRHSTRFVLRGAHARLSCSKCHPNGQFAKVIGEAGPCTNCHGTKHGGLRRCGSCHTTTSFIPTTFRHSTRYRLTGRHAKIACSKCHPRNRYASVIGQPPRCANCHGTKHGNQTDCAKCHTTAGFSPAKRIAHPVSPPLGGRHAVLSCRLCHTRLIFNEPVKPCRDCHTAPHVAPNNCLQCHTPTYWVVRHDEIGYHTGLSILEACQYCHTTGRYPDYVCDQCHFPY